MRTHISIHCGWKDWQPGHGHARCSMPPLRSPPRTCLHPCTLYNFGEAVPAVDATAQSRAGQQPRSRSRPASNAINVCHRVIHGFRSEVACVCRSSVKTGNRAGDAPSFHCAKGAALQCSMLLYNALQATQAPSADAVMAAPPAGTHAPTGPGRLARHGPKRGKSIPAARRALRAH